MIHCHITRSYCFYFLLSMLVFLYAGLEITKGTQSFYLFPSKLGLGVRVFSAALLSHH